MDNHVAAPSRPLRVLFIGNSYTYFNDMPATVAALDAASSRSRGIETAVITEDGATLDELGARYTTDDAIAEGRWDVVVLQEQSLLALTDPDKMHRAARQLDAAIRKAGARTLLFLTWARRAWPDSQFALDGAYRALARELNATLAPVGPAWQMAAGLAPGIPLYRSDGSHPTRTGSYLTACVFYLVLCSDQTQCPPLKMRGISAGYADVSRQAAAAAVAAELQWKGYSLRMP